MSNNKQTAVDYLDEAIDKYLAYCVEGSHKGEPFTLKNLYAAVQQAKEMEKRQIEDAYGVGHNEGCSYMTDGKTEFKDAEQYYNKRYSK